MEDNFTVFINCPFDEEYNKMFEASIFTIRDCGFMPRCALESEDSGEPRINRIYKIIEDCRYGIHDISRTKLSNDLPRFNMPLELGLFLGARKYGNEEQKEKNLKILDSEEFRFQKFCSDIAGQDISAHNNKIESLITIIRNWLLNQKSDKMYPSGKFIYKKYNKYVKELPTFSRTLLYEPDELTFNDQNNLIKAWLEKNNW